MLTTDFLILRTLEGDSTELYRRSSIIFFAKFCQDPKWPLLLPITSLSLLFLAICVAPFLICPFFLISLYFLALIGLCDNCWQLADLTVGPSSFFDIRFHQVPFENVTSCFLLYAMSERCYSFLRLGLFQIAFCLSCTLARGSPLGSQ